LALWTADRRVAVVFRPVAKAGAVTPEALELDDLTRIVKSSPLAPVSIPMVSLVIPYLRGS